MDALPARSSAESRLGYEIAQELASGCPPALGQEILIVGSVALGHADEGSDLDLELWVHDAPEPRQAAAWLEAAGATALIVNREPDLGVLEIAGQVRGMWLEASWHLIEARAQLFQSIRAGEETRRLYLGQAYNLRHAVLLRSAGSVGEFRGWVSDYPDAVQAGVIASASEFWTFPHRVDVLWTLARRREVLGLTTWLEADVSDALRILFAINRQWETDWKHLHAACRTLAIQPERLVERVDWVFTAVALEDRVETSLRLVLDILELVPAPHDVAAAKDNIQASLDRHQTRTGGPDREEARVSYKPPQTRTFPLWLAYEYEHHYTSNLHWLQHFAARLGCGPALSLWQGALAGYDDGLLQAILSSDWDPAEEAYAQEAEGEISALAAKLFPVPVNGVSAAEARALVDSTPPFAQLQQRFPSLDLVRETKTYEALHLFGDARALVAEAMVDRYGKEGELMIYDAMLEEMAGAGIPALAVEEYLARRLERFGSEPEEADMFTAGLDVELVRGSETEVVTRVTHCEWARYYLERHPRVGYLLACAMDNPAYRSFNERLRLQRTCTLMAGGDHCDFRVYALEDAFVGVGE